MMTLRFSLPAVTARPAYDRQLPIPCGPSTDQDHHVSASLKHSRRPPGLSSELRFDSRRWLQCPLGPFTPDPRRRRTWCSDTDGAVLPWLPRRTITNLARRRIATQIEGGLHATSLAARSARPGACAGWSASLRTAATGHYHHHQAQRHRNLHRRRPELHRRPERAGV